MRLPFIQIDMEIVELAAQDLSVLLNITEAEAGWSIVKGIKWALARCPDDAPPSQHDTIKGPSADALVARACGFAGPPAAWVDACTSISHPVLERTADGVRFRGLKRYDRAWEKNLRRRKPEPVPVTGNIGAGNRQHAGNKPATLAPPDADADAEEETTTPETDPGLVLVGVAEKTQADRLQEVWNQTAPACLPRWLKSSHSRKRRVRARLTEEPNLEVWRAAIASLAHSPFHLGENDRKWRADPDWLLKPDTLTRLLEKATTGPPTPPQTPTPFNSTRLYE